MQVKQWDLSYLKHMPAAQLPWTQLRISLLPQSATEQRCSLCSPNPIASLPVILPRVSHVHLLSNCLLQQQNQSGQGKKDQYRCCLGYHRSSPRTSLQHCASHLPAFMFSQAPFPSLLATTHLRWNKMGAPRGLIFHRCCFGAACRLDDAGALEKKSSCHP